MPAANPGPRLVDTSVWIRADSTKHIETKERLVELTVAGLAWICWPIHTELLIGVKTPERWTELDEQLSALHHAPITDDTWRQAARLGRDLARQGRTVPLTDLLIAVAALDQEIPLWTADSDFKRIASVAPLHLDWFGLVSRT
jgi:predicted nucleic acid-binding protein